MTPLSWFTRVAEPSASSDNPAPALSSPEPSCTGRGAPGSSGPPLPRSATRASNSIASPAPPRGIDWHLLFVGGDPAAFYRTDLDLACLEPRWSCRHVTTADEAVVESTSHPVDAIVIDGHLKDAGKVLDVAEKLARHPICLVRRNLLDRADSARWSRAGLTHISDGADAATLAASLNRAARLREWMADPAIKKLLPLIRKLPIASKLHADITRELESASGSTVAVAALVSEDPVIAAKILQLVNSAYFGLPHEITDMAEAVMVLGTERLRSLILLAGAFSQYEGALCPGFSSQAIWSHSLKTGTIARAIALAQTRDSRIAEAAFTAGLVHDLGKLVLAANQPALSPLARPKPSPRRAHSGPGSPSRRYCWD